MCFGFIKHKIDTIEFVDGFTYTAHTGCVGTKDNSLESIETGVKDRNNIDNILESMKLLDRLYASAAIHKEIEL